MGKIIQFPDRKDEGPMEFTVTFIQFDQHHSAYEMFGVDENDPGSLRSVAGFMESFAKILRAEAGDIEGGQD